MTLLDLARAAVRFEWHIYVALARWIARRPEVPAGAAARGYARMVTPVLCLWIFGSAAETVAFHFIVPWEVPRLVLDVLGIWGFLWMVGLLAGYRVYPHLLTDDGLRIRLGRRADVFVPWSQVASAVPVDRDLESSIRTFQPLRTEAGTDLQIGVSGRANVHLTLVNSITVAVKGEPLEVTAVTFLADDPRQLVAEVRHRIGARHGA
jgi:hypothetical protein